MPTVVSTPRTVPRFPAPLPPEVDRETSTRPMRASRLLRSDSAPTGGHRPAPVPPTGRTRPVPGLGPTGPAAPAAGPTTGAPTGALDPVGGDQPPIRRPGADGAQPAGPPRQRVLGEPGQLRAVSNTVLVVKHRT